MWGALAWESAVRESRRRTKCLKAGGWDRLPLHFCRRLPKDRRRARQDTETQLLFISLASLKAGRLDMRLEGETVCFLPGN